MLKQEKDRVGRRYQLALDLNARLTNTKTHGRKAKARMEFAQLKQGDRKPFDEFYVKFQKIAITLQKSEDNRRHDLLTKLNNRLYYPVKREGLKHISLLVQRIRELGYIHQEIDIERGRDDTDTEEGWVPNRDEISDYRRRYWPCGLIVYL
jgi:hypothetical protein